MNTRTADRVRRNVDRPTIDMAGLRSQLEVWYGHRKSEKQAKSGAEKLKTTFKAMVERFGTRDEKGSQFIEISPPVGPIVAIKNERRVTPTVNDEEAVKILQKKGMFEAPYVVMEPRIDYDAVRGAVFEKKITRGESARIFGTNETYAFVALDKDGKPVAG